MSAGVRPHFLAAATAGLRSRAAILAERSGLCRILRSASRSRPAGGLSIRACSRHAASPNMASSELALSKVTSEGCWSTIKGGEYVSSGVYKCSIRIDSTQTGAIAVGLAQRDSPIGDVVPGSPIVFLPYMWMPDHRMTFMQNLPTRDDPYGRPLRVGDRLDLTLDMAAGTLSISWYAAFARGRAAPRPRRRLTPRWLHQQWRGFRRGVQAAQRVPCARRLALQRWRPGHAFHLARHPAVWNQHRAHGPRRLRQRHRAAPRLPRLRPRLPQPQGRAQGSPHPRHPPLPLRRRVRLPAAHGRQVPGAVRRRRRPALRLPHQQHLLPRARDVRGPRLQGRAHPAQAESAF